MVPWFGPVLSAFAIAVASSGAALAAGSSVLDGLIAPPRDRVGRVWFSPVAIRRGAAAVGLLTGLALPRPGFFLAPVLCLIGLRVPAILEHRALRRRRAAMNAQIPQLLDLLAAASSAGLSGQLALRRAVVALGGPLAVELADALDAVDLGARWRDEMAAVAERLELPDLRRTVAALSRTETLGASLADSTAELAASVRAARRAAVTERARTAPVKMLFPLVFLVLPAFLLLTVVPVLLTTVRSIS
ncbi:MAG: type II secretion system F family protein [Actinomycetota bacterium]